MCDYHCLSPLIKKNYRKLTLLLLDCWQREYDKRPYANFTLERLKLEERLKRNYEPQEDFKVLLEFLTKRSLCSIKLVGLQLMNENISLIEHFVRNLQNLSQVELKLIDLPTVFFQLLACNVEYMKMEELSLKGCPLNDQDIFYLRTFIVKSKTLLQLSLASCCLNQYNFAQIADGIYKSLELKSCNLSHILGVHLTLDSDKIAHTLASLLWQNKLQEIILECCGLTGHDMEIIAEYLYRKSSNLQTLNVSFNKIGSNGALELLKAIAYSGTLKHLKMNGCSLSTHGGELMAQYLNDCLSLKSLGIQYNSIKAEAINMILLCLQHRNCELQRLHLWGNSYNKHTGDILKRLLDTKVLLQNSLDLTITFDDTMTAYRLVPTLD